MSLAPASRLPLKASGGVAARLPQKAWPPVSKKPLNEHSRPRKKSCTTWDVENQVNNGISYLTAGASTVFL